MLTESRFETLLSFRKEFSRAAAPWNSPQRCCRAEYRRRCHLCGAERHFRYWKRQSLKKMRRSFIEVRTVSLRGLSGLP